MRRQPPSRQPTATLFVQVLALVILSLIIAQSINVWVIFQLPRPTPEYYTAPEIAQALQKGPTPRSRDSHALVVRKVEVLPSPGDWVDARAFRRLRKDLGLMLDLPPHSIVVAVENSPWDRVSVDQVRRRMAKTGQAREVPFILSPFMIAVRTADGQWLVAEPPSPAFFSPWQIRITVWFLITVLAMAPMAWLVARRLSASVALFADAAERLGRDPHAPPLPITGPSEIRPAIAAFNQMQNRLRRYVEDRTAMAAAMAHDLRTPLTRLRFRVEAAPDDLHPKMTADIDEMEAMISATLSYVRDTQGATERTPLELSSLLESVVDDLAETGAKVTIDRADRTVINGDPMALRRLLTNLIENACKFAGHARARLYSDAGAAVFEIEDDGPGLPEAELEKVFEPFYRAEPSRNRGTGGTGLGLAAVRSIARLHGGEVSLRNREPQGLIAQVRLPI